MSEPTGSDGVFVIVSQPESLSGQTQTSTHAQQTGYYKNADTVGYNYPSDVTAQTPIQMAPMGTVHVSQVRRAPADDDTRGPNLVLTSICVCFCLSPLLGIFAIIFACMANSEFDAGNMEAGRRCNMYARITMGIAVAISVAIIFVYLVLSFAVLI